jgi:hypothetical protein
LKTYIDNRHLDQWRFYVGAKGHRPPNVSQAPEFSVNVKTFVIEFSMISIHNATDIILTMRNIKTYLQSSMGDERLSSLAIIAVERQLTEVLMLNPSKEIDELARSSNRQLDFIM